MIQIAKTAYNKSLKQTADRRCLAQPLCSKNLLVSLFIIRDMLHQIIISKLEDNMNAFKVLLGNISVEQARWKPSPKKWSILEVVNHLHDEEVDDFRQRLEFALLNPERPWKQVTPEKWAGEKDYNQRDLNATLNNFLTEREKSVQWLKGLTTPDWKAMDNYPYGKTMPAEQILANWLAHDYLHIRQINSLNWSYLSKIAPSADLRYAGNW